MTIIDIPASEYHTATVGDVPYLSASIAKILVKSSPKHAWCAHPALNPYYVREEKAAFDLGAAAHALLLEGKDAVELIDAEDWRTNAAKDAAKDARANGKIPLLGKHYFDVVAMVAAATEQLAVHDADPGLFQAGKPEQTLVWEDDGVHCHARVDWIHDDYAAVDDYKTTSRSAKGDDFRRTVFGFGYDVQAAFYLRGLKAVTGGSACFRFCVQETSTPYALSVVSLSDDALAIGAAKVQYALDLWHGCIDTDTWPAYPTTVAIVDAPPWEMHWLDNSDDYEEAAWSAM